MTETISLILGTLSVAEQAGYLHPGGLIRVGNEAYGVIYYPVKVQGVES